MKMIVQVIGLGRNLIIATVVGLLVGCFFGWMVMGWIVMPVKWELTPAEKEQYILMAADSYSLNGDAQLAEARLADLDDEEIGEIITRLAATHPQEKQNLLDLALGLGITEMTPQPAAVATTTPTTIRLTSSLNRTLPIVCGLFLALLLIIAIGIVLVNRLRGRREEAEAPAPAWRAEPPRAAEAMPPLTPTGPPPLGHFVTTYDLGHDTYDESFSIETPMGEFLGECGVGISEALGADELSRKVTAFEVWLFDKSDIRTVTKVLMSPYAYNDDALQAKLAPKGDPVLAELGKSIVLETTSLRVDARVVDLEYDGGAVPPQSQFTKLTVELMATPIETGGELGGWEE
jgi:hypothetical protein